MTANLFPPLTADELQLFIKDNRRPPNDDTELYNWVVSWRSKNKTGTGQPNNPFGPKPPSPPYYGQPNNPFGPKPPFPPPPPYYGQSNNPFGSNLFRPFGY